MGIADDVDRFVRQLPPRHPDDYVPETTTRATVSPALLRARIGHLEDENAALREAYFALRDRPPAPARDRRATQHARDSIMLALLVCAGAVIVVGGLLILGYGLTALRDASAVMPR